MSTTAGPAALPAASPLPPLAQALMFLVSRRATLRYMQRRHGDAFGVEIAAIGPGVVVSDPALVKQVFTASPDVLLGGEGNPLAAVLGPGSFFALDGDRHRAQRKLLLPPFHGERMKTYEAIIEEETLREIATWPEGVELATAEPMMRITLNAILRAVFGAEGAELDALRDLLPRFVTLGSQMALRRFMQRDLGPRSPWGRFQVLREHYDLLVDALIAQALRGGQLEERTDVLALMLQARYEDGAPMDHRDVADQLLTLLTAGHETTATTLAWAVERLRRHPDVLDRLVAEADEGGTALRKATILEVQRTRPVVVLTARRVAQPFALGEWTIPPGHQVFVAMSLVHDDDRVWGDAAAFRPDRFVGRSPDTYSWVPFGGGTRRCIGAAFAHMEMDVVLRTLLRELTLSPTSARPERWHSRGITYAPAKGGLAVVHRRRDPPAADGTSGRRALAVA